MACPLVTFRLWDVDNSLGVVLVVAEAFEAGFDGGCGDDVEEVAAVDVRP